MKTLTTKKLNFVVCWGGLRKMAPKEFTTLEEMEKVQSVIEVIEKEIPEFAKHIIASEEENKKLNMKLADKKVTPEEVADIRNKIHATSLRLEDLHGDKVLSVKFEDAWFNAFFQMFEAHSKVWFNNVKALLECRTDMNKTNSQPKDKGESKKK